MARRHKKSNRNVVQVNPDATLNYVTGILTGANNYISGLLEGANQYNAWVQTEMTLEGTEIGEYRPDALRNYLDSLKKTKPQVYTKLMSDPYSFIMNAVKTNNAQDLAVIAEMVEKTNYKRLKNTDLAMIEASKQYRDQIPTLIKSRNMETGLTILQTYAPNSVKVMDRINGILTSGINYNG